MNADLVLFYLLAAGLLVSGAVMIGAKNVVHGVIAMVVNFVMTAVLYLALHAPFLFVVQVTIYAGAIMVLFLFVVMILGNRDVSLAEPLGNQRVLGVGAAALLGGLLIWAAGSSGNLPVAPAATVPPDFGSPAMMGQALFTRFVLPFELVGVLLLSAVLGAVVIGQFRGGGEEAASEGTPEGGPAGQEAPP